MAFNPFSAFREHKKGALVALTILTMIIFIGQFGAGDPVGQVMNFFGAGKAGGQVVTTLYGKKVRMGDLDQLAQRRKIASQFLFSTTSIGHGKVRKDLTKKFEAPAQGNPLFGAAHIFEFYKTGLQQQLNFVQQLPPQYRQGYFEQVEADGAKHLRDLEKYIYSERDRLKDDDKVALNQLIVLLGSSLSKLRLGADGYYFGGSPRTEDLLDFRLWQAQADKLGIKLTDDDVIKEVKAEAADGELFESSLSFAEQPQVRNYLGYLRRQDRGAAATTSEELLDSLRDEFRMVIAQSILLGSEPGARSYRSSLGVANTPSLATPDEFLRFYQEKRTALRVELFPIEASSFLAKVDRTPTEDQLRMRFKRGEKREASLSERQAGFKRPRRIAVEYVVASPEDQFYAELGRKAAVYQRFLEMAQLLTAPGLAKALPLAADPLAADFAKALYDNPDQGAFIANPELGADFVWSYDKKNNILADIMRTRLHLTSVIHPASLASAIVGAGLRGGPLAGLSSLYATSTREELRRSLPFNLSMLLSRGDPRQIFGAAALAVGTLPPPVPRSLVAPQIMLARDKKFAEEALRKNIATMATELSKLGKKPDAARAYVAKAVKDYHLHVYSMPAAETMDELTTDLKGKKNIGLDALRKVMKKEDNKAETLRGFVSTLFSGEGAYAPQNPQDAQRQQFAKPPEGGQQGLWWRKEDQKAKERSFKDARADVLAAWKLDEARTLARKEAERLEEELNKKKLDPKKAVEEAESFLEQQKAGKPFVLEDVSERVRPKEVQPNPKVEYHPYQVPENQADKMPYPPFDLPKQLMKLTRPGEATVIVDRPARTYYVALLVERAPPGLDKFKKLYVNAASNQLYGEFQARRTYDYRQAVLEQLRREASGELDKDGRFKLPDSVRKQDAGPLDGD